MQPYPHKQITTNADVDMGSIYLLLSALRLCICLWWRSFNAVVENV